MTQIILVEVTELSGHVACILIFKMRLAIACDFKHQDHLNWIYEIVIQW